MPASTAALPPRLPDETIRFFTTGRRTHVVEPRGCIGCDLCVQVCPENCIVPDTEYVHDPLELAAAKESAKARARNRNDTKRAHARAGGNRDRGGGTMTSGTEAAHA